MVLFSLSLNEVGIRCSTKSYTSDLIFLKAESPELL